MSSSSGNAAFDPQLGQSGGLGGSIPPDAANAPGADHTAGFSGLLILSGVYVAVFAFTASFPVLANDTFRQFFIGPFGLRMVSFGLCSLVAITACTHVATAAPWDRGRRVLSGLLVATLSALALCGLGVLWVLQGPVAYC
ncbi:hypothetical protein [Corynebacterium aquilae]|uniref:Uncharacterized protein n=1 Tax=Corynebacterium aquilae DSM 44791 TaxID=1431546 RepID=A0A1L7CI83_9CORY|nr:hypothetical protein [Corynebacterium aquilae]APT85564.1 hypothetical protein CAQU_11495 [Corynebacterium aquilae DSM 44791]